MRLRSPAARGSARSPGVGAAHPPYKGDPEMPLAKIHILEGRYDEPRLGRLSQAVQESLIRVLKIPPDDFFQIIHELPRRRFLHTPSFLGLKYSDDFILLELAFSSAQGIERAHRRWRRNIAG